MTTKENSAPGQCSSQRQIQESTQRLIDAANRAQVRGGKVRNMDDTRPTELERVPAVAQAQDDLVKAILAGWECGVGPDEIFQGAIKPVLDRAVVSEVARGALGRALSCVAA